MFIEKHFSGDVIAFIRPTDTNKEPSGWEGKETDKLSTS